VRGILRSTGETMQTGWMTEPPPPGPRLSPEPTVIDMQMLDRAARRGALLGSVIACAVIVGAAFLMGPANPWLLALVPPAVVASVVLAASRARATRRQVLVAADRRVAVAEALLANIPDPVILVDRRSLVRETNAAAMALLPALRKNHPLSFALRAPEVLDGIEEVLRSGSAMKVEYSERVPTERSFEVLVGPLESPGNGSVGERDVMLFFRDLTDARRLENMRVDFIANVSHELRTPLASVLGFIETLQGPARDDTTARERFLAIIREQAQRMTRLIDDLLSLSRIELRAHMTPRTLVDLVPVTRQIIDTLTPLARESDVAIDATLPDAPLVIRGDRDELLRVVENLLENAIKYGGSGKRVVVCLERIGDGVRLGVRDFGPGIAPEHLPRLTERFYRGDATQSRQKGGTGLGLAIVKHIVVRHRGKLSIESEIGKGAVFTAEFPAAAEERSASSV
jgi:two-component system, OmpR family, phosphate regulon sensor histidine kinase PhoR